MNVQLAAMKLHRSDESWTGPTDEPFVFFFLLLYVKAPQLCTKCSFSSLKEAFCFVGRNEGNICVSERFGISKQAMEWRKQLREWKIWYFKVRIAWHAKDIPFPLYTFVFH